MKQWGSQHVVWSMLLIAAKGDARNLVIFILEEIGNLAHGQPTKWQLAEAQLLVYCPGNDNHLKSKTLSLSGSVRDTGRPLLFFLLNQIRLPAVRYEYFKRASSELDIGHFKSNLWRLCEQYSLGCRFTQSWIQRLIAKIMPVFWASLPKQSACREPWSILWIYLTYWSIVDGPILED